MQLRFGSQFAKFAPWFDVGAREYSKSVPGKALNKKAPAWVRQAFARRNESLGRRPSSLHFVSAPRISLDQPCEQGQSSATLGARWARCATSPS